MNPYFVIGCVTEINWNKLLMKLKTAEYLLFKFKDFIGNHGVTLEKETLIETAKTAPKYIKWILKGISIKDHDNANLFLKLGFKSEYPVLNFDHDICYLWMCNVV